jgi:hypothetical protein
MRFCAVWLGAALAALVMSSASATIRISGDAGGQIGPYLDRMSALRHSGERIVIDGPCLSACTLVLGAIPHNRICVTRRAQLGFHAAWRPGEYGQRVISRGGTKLLMDNYPPEVKRWIARRGGLRTQMMYLSGRELTSMYQSCE